MLCLEQVLHTVQVGNNLQNQGVSCLIGESRMTSVCTRTYINATAIPGGVSVSLTRLAIWGVAIFHLASIIPTVEMLKHANQSVSWVVWGAPWKRTPHPL